MLKLIPEELFIGVNYSLKTNPSCQPVKSIVSSVNYQPKLRQAYIPSTASPDIMHRHLAHYAISSSHLSSKYNHLSKRLYVATRLV